eukprot:XP_001698631.1 predicted protein [Chlamydomonas reinhardtii]
MRFLLSLAESSGDAGSLKAALAHMGEAGAVGSVGQVGPPGMEGALAAAAVPSGHGSKVSTVRTVSPGAIVNLRAQTTQAPLWLEIRELQQAPAPCSAAAAASAAAAPAPCSAAAAASAAAAGSIRASADLQLSNGTCKVLAAQEHVCGGSLHVAFLSNCIGSPAREGGSWACAPVAADVVSYLDAASPAGPAPAPQTTDLGAWEQQLSRTGGVAIPSAAAWAGLRGTGLYGNRVLGLPAEPAGGAASQLAAWRAIAAALSPAASWARLTDPTVFATPDGPAPAEVAQRTQTATTVICHLSTAYRRRPWLGCGRQSTAGRGIAVGVVAAAVLLVASALFKRRVMPGYGQQTTLVVTDIQDSTVLWEAVPAAVMDLSLNQHNHCCRQLVRKYHGYETHTEGDSFTLAFHSAVEATCFALELQHISPPQHGGGSARLTSPNAGDWAVSASGGSITGGSGFDVLLPSGPSLIGAAPSRSMSRFAMDAGALAARSPSRSWMAAAGLPSLSGRIPHSPLRDATAAGAGEYELRRRQSRSLDGHEASPLGSRAGSYTAGHHHQGAPPPQHVPPVPVPGHRLGGSRAGSRRGSRMGSRAGSMGEGGGGGREAGLDAAPEGGASGSTALDYASGRSHSAGAASLAAATASAINQSRGASEDAAGRMQPHISPGGTGYHLPPPPPAYGGAGDPPGMGMAPVPAVGFGAPAGLASVSTQVGSGGEEPAGPPQAARREAAAVVAALALPARVKSGHQHLPASRSEHGGSRLHAAEPYPQHPYPYPQQQGAAGRVAPNRGFRVRVGIHSGLDEGADVFWTKRSGRRAYSGSAMRQARLLSDAALGGMVVLSTACLELLRPLPNERLPLGAMVWHSGRFRLGDREGCVDVDVFQALLPTLLPRLQAFRGEPLRVLAALMPGLLEAPVGPVALATCQVYPAVTCLLSLEDDLKSCVPWPPALLEHELGEEICCVLPPGPDGVCVTQLVHCGPRVRCAAEWFADVRLDLGVTRGVQLYRNAGSGKPWKNLQRLLRQAKMGQTLVSGSIQRLLQASGGPLLEHMHRSVDMPLMVGGVVVSGAGLLGFGAGVGSTTAAAAANAGGGGSGLAAGASSAGIGVRAIAPAAAAWHAGGTGREGRDSGGSASRLRGSSSEVGGGGTAAMHRISSKQLSLSQAALHSPSPYATYAQLTPAGSAALGSHPYLDLALTGAAATVAAGVVAGAPEITPDLPEGGSVALPALALPGGTAHQDPAGATGPSAQAGAHGGVQSYPASLASPLGPQQLPTPGGSGAGVLARNHTLSHRSYTAAVLAAASPMPSMSGAAAGAAGGGGSGMWPAQAPTAPVPLAQVRGRSRGFGLGQALPSPLVVPDSDGNTAGAEIAPGGTAAAAAGTWAGGGTQAQERERGSRPTLRGLLVGRLLSSDFAERADRGAIYVCRWKWVVGPWQVQGQQPSQQPK